MFQGTVQRVFSNPVRGNMLHSFTLNNVKGFFNLGRVAPTFKEGASITFEAKPASREGNHDVVVETIVIGKDAPVSTEAYTMTAQTGARKTTMLQKDDYWNRREERDQSTQKVIELQSCRNSAIALLAVARERGLSDDEASEFLDKWVDIFLQQNAKHRDAV